MAPSQRDFDRLIRQGEEFARQQAEDARRRDGPDDSQTLARGAEEQLFEGQLAADNLMETGGEELLEAFDELLANDPDALPDLNDEQAIADFFVELDEVAERQDQERLEREQTLLPPGEEVPALPPASSAGCPNLEQEAEELGAELDALETVTDPDVFQSRLQFLEGRINAFQAREDNCNAQTAEELAELQRQEASGEPLRGEAGILAEEAGFDAFMRAEDFDERVSQDPRGAIQLARQRGGIDAVFLADEEVIERERQSITMQGRRDVASALREELETPDILPPGADDLAAERQSLLDAVDALPDQGSNYQEALDNITDRLDALQQQEDSFDF